MSKRAILANKWNVERGLMDQSGFSMEPIQTQGVSLQLIRVGDYDRILTLFTPQGLLKLYVKGRGRDFLRLNALIAPLTVGEYLYHPGRGEIGQFREGTILKQNLKIRERLETLIAAEECSVALLRTQLSDKPAAALYVLFLRLLEALGNSLFPERFLSLLRLKILKHEGLLQEQEGCSQCGSSQCVQEKTFRAAGECYCAYHAPAHSLEFSREEDQLLMLLANTRSLSLLEQTEQGSSWISKISILFEQAL